MPPPSSEMFVTFSIFFNIFGFGIGNDARKIVIDLHFFISSLRLFLFLVSFVFLISIKSSPRGVKGPSHGAIKVQAAGL